MKIKVKTKKVGKRMCHYPMDQTGWSLASLGNRTCFSNEQIEILIGLGYEIDSMLDINDTPKFELVRRSIR